MKNRYEEKEAQAFVGAYPQCPAELALRVYTSRLLGAEEDLVLHGGGNTSVKGVITNLVGEEQEILYIKGSGWDLGVIAPQGFPALDLAYLRKLRQVQDLSDAEMVNQFRTHLLDAASPNPSIETLVHAFLPHRFIDHTHADAIVTLSNREDGAKQLHEALGTNIAILPFIMPGLPLARAMAELYESRPEIDCIILANHGIFTFGDDAKTAYDRMIDYVSRAEAYLAERGPGASAGEAVDPGLVQPSLLLPILRGGLSFVEDSGRRRTMQLAVRQNKEILAALFRPDAQELFVNGVLTPDHVIRTKNYPLWLEVGGLDEEGTLAAVQTGLGRYQEEYDRYFAEQVAAKAVSRTKLDAMPRVILVPGLGLVAAGFSQKDAGIAADIAEHTLTAKLRGAGLGPYRELGADSIFDMEYWALEQAKLGKAKPKALEGRTALVTGGGGAIAMGIGRKLLEAGARVFMTDINQERLEAVCHNLADTFGSRLVSPLLMDVTSEESVRLGLAQLVMECGGLDILVPNAGIAHVAKLADLSEAAFRQVMEVNCLGVFQVIKGVIPILRRQGTGGSIVINSSKNVFAPGASFGAYSASKAGAHQLGKIAALELAEFGVRVNMINADAIFDDAGVSSGLWDVIGPERMRSRNLDPEGLKDYYRQRNLLKTTVHADHVGNAVVFFASEQTPTTGATLPVDGGIMAAFPR
ncbi:bifunctional aldolase/short-chain dehydrogenase [Thiovibrio frasassiensis]|uniref:Bifunctional aldolase/short-chain dehydrogenase n=1 Tax=Thiovibrio frasassiensis TaxID=2984131 RepID=A0A9X4MGA9_9BACT|nr:bifunctional aldolase/short-chain dehydrogenase [Thiovibrio frasassiensis]MDG4475345.1 bifunctional aldolase/short-chain dehydrogenase [Thiovibrio frasassiensis]